jgi:GT2 family glycosyltransferase/glycosyltransferase involved in cell wall biosynthesis
VIVRVKADPKPEAERRRLEGVFGELTRAIGEGRLEAALRFADCAHRIAPDHLYCLLLHARLLVQLGDASAAAEMLRDREEPEAIVAHGEALCAQGLYDDAADAWEALVWRRAVDSVEGLGQLAALLCRTPGREFAGWVGVDTGLRLVGQVETGSSLRIASASGVWSATICVVDQDGLDTFVLDGPRGLSGRLDIYASGRKLLGSGMLWPPEFGLAGWVILENKQLVGEVQLEWAPPLPVTLAIGSFDRKDIRLRVITSAPGSVGKPFSIGLGELDSCTPPLDVYALLPDGRYSPLIGSPVRMQTALRPPTGVCQRRKIAPGLGRVSSSKQNLDVVVPVYAGREETLCCIERVLGTTTRDEVEVVVINDASPDSELSDALADLARDGRITLLTNQSNLGFPGTANRGISLHPERDIVLLNSDAEPFGNWLERLKFAAYSSDDVGTVTPLGEVASITSYPGKVERRHTIEEAEQIDRSASEANARKVVELPVGVGFCLYIKRACLEEVGSFDDRNFDKGYGEENDFCLRARALGWRHLAATDLFMRHRGARSYGRAKRVLTERNRRVLSALHPAYDALVANFIKADPLHEARRAIDMHRLLSDAIDPVLLVTSDLPGGVKRHVNERQSVLTTAGKAVVVLQPAGTPDQGDRIILRIEGKGLENLVFQLPEESAALRAFLFSLRLSRIEVHHFVGLPAATLGIITTLGVVYEVYIHDYSWICPRLTLAGENGSYCGEPPVEECESCIRKHGTALEKSLSVKALRSRSANIFQLANTVVAPSNDVGNRLARYFPELPVKVMPWEKAFQPAYRPRATPGERVRVVVIGAISIPKGFQVLLECAQDAAERNLRLDFIVIGFTCNDPALLATRHAFITGPYVDNEIAALLQREQAHVAFFPSTIPETWCYALSHALAWGLPIVAFALGAIAERLSSYAAAELLPLSMTAAGINAALLQSAQRVTTSEVQKEIVMDSALTKNDEPVTGELSTSVEVLTLPVGTYAFTVKTGSSSAVAGEELTLPALQVSLAPASSSGTAEFVAGATTLDRWLVRSSDIIVVKISGAGVSLLLTSLRSPTSPVMAIDVRRIDNQPLAATPEAQMGQAVSEGTSGVLPTRIVAHIQNIGDLHFSDGWVGCLGQRLWIEAFAVLSVGELRPNEVEYCAVIADGSQTPWLSNQMLCGSRGRLTPIVGYAVRLRPETAEHYECTYSGRFVSGGTSEPFTNGALCRSDVPGEPLWGIELHIAPRRILDAANPNAKIGASSVA